MSLENGLILAAAAANGMPLVVEISVALSVLVAFIVIGIFLFAFANASTQSTCWNLTACAENAENDIRDFHGVERAHRHSGGRRGVLAMGEGDYRRSARNNVVACAVTFFLAIVLLLKGKADGSFLFVDDLNIVFVVALHFVGFTTSVFSASYIAHEIETGRLTPSNLRFYHAMYQALMCAMNLALLASNIGLMWVAVEVATLTTVLMVGIYRTHEALERPGNISFWAASASRSRSSAPSSSTWRRARAGRRL